MIGDITPKMRFADEARPLPVPRTLVGKSSGVTVYKAAHMTYVPSQFTRVGSWTMETHIVCKAITAVPS